jgi:hypothetical protein
MFVYPRSKQGNFGEAMDMLPFYAYLNWLFRRTMTPREGYGTKILAYNKNILAAMASNANGFEFFVFDFIWEDLKAISENPLKSCGYAPYLMHMVERVTARTFFYEMEHHPLWIKNDLRAPVVDLRAAHHILHLLGLLAGEGSQETNLHPLFRKYSACCSGCASPNMPQM